MRKPFARTLNGRYKSYACCVSSKILDRHFALSATKTKTILYVYMYLLHNHIALRRS